MAGEVHDDRPAPGSGPRDPDDPESPTRRTRVFGALASLALRRSRAVALVFLVLVIASLALIPGIRVSTSRYALVAPDNAYQARLLRFFDRFGYPDAPVLVVSGGDASSRRRTVDRLAERFEREPVLAGKVMARVGPEQVAETLLLQEQVLAALPASPAGGGAALAEVIEGGLPAWIGALERQVTAGLSGPAVAPEPIDAGLRGLAGAARALEQTLAGSAPTGLSLPGQTDAPARQGLDEEGYLVGAAGEDHVIALFPELPGGEGHQLRPLVAMIRAARDEVMAAAGPRGGAPDGAPPVEVVLTGLPALSADELGIVEAGLFKSTVVSTLGIIALLLVVFRSLRYAMMTLLSIGAGVILTLGAVRLIYGELNLITSSFVSVLLGLGDFGVYVLSRYSELRRAGGGAAESMRAAMTRTGPGVLTGAITVALAFMTTTTIEFTAFAQLGVISSVGIGSVLLTTFILLPSLAQIAGRGDLAPAPETPGMRSLPRIVRAARYPILAAAVLATVLGAVSLPKLRFNSRYFDFLPDRTESAVGLARLEAGRTMSPTFANLTAEGVEEARALTATLRAVPSVGSVQSATDLLPPLTPERLATLRGWVASPPRLDALAARRSSATEVAPRVRALVDAVDEVAFALRQSGRPTAAADEAKAALAALQARLAALPEEGRPQIAAIEGAAARLLGRAFGTARAVAARGHYLPEDLPPQFRTRFASKDGKALAVYAYPAGNVWDPVVAERFGREVQAVQPEASGLAVSIHEHEKMILEGFRYAVLFAAALVIGALLLDFRNLADTALTLVPLALGSLWMLGAMAAFGLTFNVANIVVLPLLLGLGVDSGAHIIHRYRDSAREHGGVARIDDILRTGAAVLLVSSTTIVGFAALTVADYGAMKSLGLVMTIGMSACLAASLLVLPAILVALGRAR